MTNKKNGVLYVGVSGDLIQRVYAHKTGVIEGFTEKYKLHRLVYYEATTDIQAALAREKQIKKWNREWKIRLIKKMNPEWKGLYQEIL